MKRGLKVRFQFIVVWKVVINSMKRGLKVAVKLPCELPRPKQLNEKRIERQKRSCRTGLPSPLSQWKEDWKRHFVNTAWKLRCTNSMKRGLKASLSIFSWIRLRYRSMKRGLKAVFDPIFEFAEIFWLNEKRIESYIGWGYIRWGRWSAQWKEDWKK